MSSYGVSPFQCLELSPEIVGVDEVLKVPPQLIVAVVVEAFDGVLDGPVYLFDLAVIRYVIFGAFSSCCSSFGTALW
jgi:hypothetical protein